MGAWGVQFNEDDTTLDWLDAFEDEMSWRTVAGAFAAAKGADYLEYEDCCAVLASGEIVAAALGHENPLMSDSIAAWAKAHSEGASPLREAAFAAVTQVRDSSELSELWSESEDSESWTSTVNDLLHRLK